MTVKGWCPGAWRPMMSGDGLIVRVRPRLGQLSAAQATGLCDIAETHASGVIDLTNRANLQLRGVREAAHEDVLDALLALGLLDSTPDLESRRNIILAPVRTRAGRSERLVTTLTARLQDLPPLSAKFGFVVDAEGPRQLSDAPGDIRIETASGGGLIVRADGSDLGQPVTEQTAIDTVISLANWFHDTAGPDNRRMAPLLETTALPRGFALAPADPGTQTLAPGPCANGFAYGAPFGSITAPALRALLKTTQARTFTAAPNRLFILDGTPATDTAAEFVTRPGDPRLTIHACPGAPFCGAASVVTRPLAASFAHQVQGQSLHVSGCAKGCAHPRRADVVAVGRDGAFDLVRDGHPWDDPRRRGIDPADLAAELERMK